jgi:hypothetical protein
MRLDLSIRDKQSCNLLCRFKSVSMQLAMVVKSGSYGEEKYCLRSTYRHLSRNSRISSAGREVKSTIWKVYGPAIQEYFTKQFKSEENVMLHHFMLRRIDGVRGPNSEIC